MSIKSPYGALIEINAYTDEAKPFGIVYCGRDTGKRYARLGNAAKYLASIVDRWGEKETTLSYEYPMEIKICGFNEAEMHAFRDKMCHFSGFMTIEESAEFHDRFMAM
jgi:hypothetical protein